MGLKYRPVFPPASSSSLTHLYYPSLHSFCSSSSTLLLSTSPFPADASFLPPLSLFFHAPFYTCTHTYKHIHSLYPSMQTDKVQSDNHSVTTLSIFSSKACSSITTVRFVIFIWSPLFLNHFVPLYIGAAFIITWRLKICFFKVSLQNLKFSHRLRVWNSLISWRNTADISCNLLNNIKEKIPLIRILAIRYRRVNIFWTGSGAKSQCILL